MKVQSKRCPVCHEIVLLKVEEKDWERWNKGEVIQKCFPYLSREERERLITGLHGKCWTDYLGPDTEGHA